MAIRDAKTGGVIFDSVSIDSTVYSDIVDISRSTNVGIDFLTDTYVDAVGALEIQVCNDVSVSSPNWVPVEFSDGSTSIVIAASTSKFFDLQGLSAKYLRLAYTATSGSGNTARAVAHVKHNVGV